MFLACLSVCPFIQDSHKSDPLSLLYMFFFVVFFKLLMHILKEILAYKLVTE